MRTWGAMLEIFLVCEAATGRPAPGIAGDMAGTWEAGRLAALRDSYTIANAARAAAPRGKPHAGRASSGRFGAASASSDPCSKIGFYLMILEHVRACHWAVCALYRGRPRFVIGLLA